MQLYFVEQSRKDAKKQLIQLRNTVDLSKAKKMECEQQLAERQRAVKDLSREMNKLEHKVTREVGASRCGAR